MATIGSLIVNLEARSERLEAELKKAQASLKRTQTDMAKLGTGMGAVERNVTQGFSRMTQGMAGMQAGLTKTTQLFGTLFTAVAAFGGLQLVKQTLALGDSLIDMSQQVNVSVEALQGLRFAAEQSGGSAVLMDRALNVLNERLGDAAAGSIEAQQAFADLGIRWQDLKGLNTEEVFLLISDALQRFPDIADRAARQAAIFGDRSRALGNTLALGSERIREMQERITRLGGVLSTDAAQKLADATDELQALGTVIQTRVAVAVADLAPLIVTVADSLLEMIAAASGSAEAFAALSSQEQAIVNFFQSLITLGRPVVSVLGAIAQKFSEAISFFEVKPIVDDLKAVNAQIRAVQEQLSRPPPIGAEGLLGRVTPAQDPQALQERLQTLLAIQDRYNTELNRIAQQGGPGPAPAPVQLPAVTIAGKRTAKDVSITDPFKVPKEDAAKKAADAAQKSAEAFAESQRALENWVRAMQIAGQPVDVLQEKIALLSNRIKEQLGKPGVDPASDAIQSLVQQMVTLQQEAANSTAEIETFKTQMAAIELPNITPILEELDKKNRALDASIQLLGPSADEASTRISSLRQAMEQALQQGVLPFDQGLQDLNRQLTMLEEKQAWARGIEQGLTAVRDTSEETRGNLIALGEGMETQFEEPRARLQRVTEELEAVRDVMGESFQPTFDRAMRSAQIEFARTTLVGQGLTIVADGIAEAFQQSFEGIVQGTLTVKEAFRNMATSIAASISKILIQKGVEALLGLALQALVPTGPALGPGRGTGGYAGGPGGALAAMQHGGKVPGTVGGQPDNILARLTPGEFVLQRRAVDALGMDLLMRMNQLPSFQTGGPVLPMPRGVMSTQRSQQAPVQVTHTAIIVKSDAEAAAKRQELEQFENQVVTIIAKNVMAGDGSLVNRSIRMVHTTR